MAGLISVLFLLAEAGESRDIATHGEPRVTFEGTPAIRRGMWRGHSIDFRVLHGQALFQGDMLIPLEEIEPIDGTRTKDARSSLVVRDPARRWPDATVVYVLDASLPAARQTIVMDSIRAWQDRTNNAVKFRERTTEAGFVRIRRVASGCSATLGHAGQEQFVNLADACSLGNTIHELGHTLGFHHTQSRIDRNRHIRVFYENILLIERSQYDQALIDGMDLGGYDYQSIMHYSVTGFVSPENRPSFETIPAGIPVGQRADLSPQDVASVKRLYGLATQSVTVTTTPPGLSVLVDGIANITPSVFDWAAGEHHTISVEAAQQTADGSSRFEFAHWSDGGDRDHSITVIPGDSVYAANMRQWVRVGLRPIPDNGGAAEITGIESDGYYLFGTPITIRAVAGEGFALLQWFAFGTGVTAQGANGLGLSANPSTILLTRTDLAYEARFSRQPVTTITSAPEGRTLTIDGTSRLTPQGFNWAAGSSHTILAPAQNASPYERFRFTGWPDGNAEGRLTVTAGGEHASVRASFQQHFSVLRGNDWLVNASAATRPNNNNLVFVPAADGDFYPAGTTIEPGITGEDPLWSFSNWTNDLTGGSRQKTLLIDRPRRVVANFTSAPFFNASATVNDAGMQPSAIVPGALLRVFLHSPSLPEEPVQATPNAQGQFPAALHEVSVSVGAASAAVVSVSRRNIVFVVPHDLPAGNSLNLSIRAGTTNSRLTLSVLDALPALYTADGSGNGLADAVNESGSAITAGLPASRGSVLFVRLTGAGALEGNFALAGNGTAARPVLPLDADIGGIPAEIVSVTRPAGFPPGVLRIGLRVPGDAPVGGEIPITVRANSIANRSRVFVPLW